MKWSVMVNGEKSLLTVLTTQNFSVNDYRKLMTAILDHPLWEPGMNCLFDHRKLSFANICYRDMVEACRIHELCSTRFGAGKLALLMETQASFGMGRMFETLMYDRADIQVKVFLFEAEARTWLCTKDSTVPLPH